MYELKESYEARKIEELIRQLEIEGSEYGFGSQNKRRKIENSMTPEEQEKDVLNEVKLRQIYDPVRKIFDDSKRRATYLPENNRDSLPKEVSPRIENELGMLRETIMKEFHKLKRRE